MTILLAITFPSQHLWLSKLLGYDYKIKYRNRKENIVIDTLSRVSNNELNALIVSIISINLMEKIKKTWKKDRSVKSLI
jgi:hypothetical protein